MTTGGVLVADGNVTLGNVGNVHISGGTSGYFLSTDGNGSLDWADAASSVPADPMPIVIDEGNTLTIRANYQGLFAYPLTIDGNLEIDGILIDVSGQGPAGTTGQIQYNGNADFGASSGFTFNSSTGNVAIPGSLNMSGLVKFQSYSKVALANITGTIGCVAVVNDSNPGGQLVFWDTTNNRWSYVCDNTAVGV